MPAAVSVALRRRVAGWAATGADALLCLELPALPADRRATTAAFVGRRVEQLPSPMAVGVGAVAAAVRVLGVVAGDTRTLAGLSRVRPPLLGEYVRLLRSLAFAHVWEHWPETAADGRAVA